MKKRKSFGLSLVFWFFGCMIGLHRIYIQERMSIILWYWLVATLTFGLLPLIDLFRLRTLIDREMPQNIYINNITGGKS